MKDKLKEEIIDELVGLKSKMYSFASINDKKLQKQKV